MASLKMKGVTTFAEYFSYDYNNIFNEAGVSRKGYEWFSNFAHPAVPLVAVALYLLLSDAVVTFIAKLFKIQPKGAIDTFVRLHNAFLAVYSFYVFFNSVQITYAFLQEHGLYGTLCASKADLWDGKMDFWIFNFYISKYYEFIDTWIHFVKGKKPSFLQVFHHAGIAILMWALYVSYSSPVVICVCFNSFIHTLMYTYYADSATFKWFKPYMTSMQIVQLVVGTALTIPTHFLDGCLNQAQHLTLFAMESYTVTLSLLFWSFYKAEYLKKKEIKNTAPAGLKRMQSSESIASSASSDNLAEPYFKPKPVVATVSAVQK